MEKNTKVSLTQEVAYIVGLAALVLAVNYFGKEISNTSASQSLIAALTIVFVVIIALKFLMLLITIFSILHGFTSQKKL